MPQRKPNSLTVSNYFLDVGYNFLGEGGRGKQFLAGLGCRFEVAGNVRSVWQLPVYHVYLQENKGICSCRSRRSRMAQIMKKCNL